MAPLRADDLVASEAERASLAALREVTADVDGPMERHCVRVFVMAERLARPTDREALLCACVLHDIGAYPGASRGGVYVTDGRLYAEELLRPFGWPEQRLRLTLDAIELHHTLRPQWSRGAEVEGLRRADLVDATAGLAGFGLPRGWIRGLFAAVPRDGFWRELGGLLARNLRERPATLPRIFTAGRSGGAATSVDLTPL